MPDMKNIAVLGSNWGLILALILHQRGYRIRLWEFSKETAHSLASRRENKALLPEVSIPEAIEISADLPLVLSDADACIMALPSFAVRPACRMLKDAMRPDMLLVNAGKGLEKDSLLRMSQVIGECLGDGVRLVSMSGPNIAIEIAKHVPSATVVASARADDAAAAQSLLMSPHFRVYTSDDVAGVELGGALKNVIAIASGIIDGLGYGANTKGALLTRGMAEITRLGSALGARPETFAGLSGMGDLVATCISQHSRNRYVGEQLGFGRKVGDIISGMSTVAEGVQTTGAAHRLAQRHGVEMPITQQMHQVLFEDKPPRDAVRELMLRDPKPERS